MRTTRLAILCAAVLAASCNSSSSVTVSTPEARVRLTAVTDNIIRVQAVPQGAEFSDMESLCVLPQESRPQKGNLQKGTRQESRPQKGILQKGRPKTAITRTEGSVSLTTGSGFKATVDTRSGKVTFTDAAGQVLTAEHERSFKPIEIEGKKAWTVFQSFDSPADEAFTLYDKNLKLRK